jgi:Leucine-rich repeat (LRR) protein
MECLSTLTSLQSLWLGKNKIEAIAAGSIGHLPLLRQLDLQNNRLTR